MTANSAVGLTASATDAHAITYRWTFNGVASEGAALNATAQEGANTASVVAPPALDPCCRSGLRFFQPWGLWLRSSGLLFATFLLLSLFSLVAGLLLASHLYLVASPAAMAFCFLETLWWEFTASYDIVVSDS